MRRFAPFAYVIAGLAVVLGGGVSAVAQAATPPNGLAGTWMTEDGRSKIRFELCGSDTCGRIVWLKFTTDPNTGKPPTDKNNPNPALRSRPIIGMVVFSAIKPDGEGGFNAQAYNAEDSNTYDVTLRPKDPATLELEGCGLGGLICQTQTWKRAE